MGAEAPEEEPQASQDGDEETAWPAAPQQETDLFHRFPGRPVRGQAIFKTENRAEAAAQGTTIAGRVERRRKRPRACDGAAAGRRANAAAIPRPEAKKTAAEKGGQVLSQAGDAEGIATSAFRPECSQQLAVAPKERMRAVELADREMVRDHAAETSVWKPAVEMKGRRLDLERGLAQMLKIEIDGMVG